MITDEQYIQAKDLIKAYGIERSKAVIQVLRCVCCNKSMEPVEKMLFALDALEQSSWKDGTVTLVKFGYGSRLHDGSAYYAAFCDECMQNAIEQGIVIDYNAI
jgi:hypothetical protein